MQEVNAMPWCPKCGTEYRDGFKKCTDCNVELTNQNPKTKNKQSRLSIPFLKTLDGTLDIVFISFTTHFLWFFSFAFVTEWPLEWKYLLFASLPLECGIVGFIFGFKFHNTARILPVILGWILSTGLGLLFICFISLAIKKQFFDKLWLLAPATVGIVSTLSGRSMWYVQHRNKSAFATIFCLIVANLLFIASCFILGIF